MDAMGIYECSFQRIFQAETRIFTVHDDVSAKKTEKPLKLAA